MIWAVSLSTTDLITRSLTPVYGYLEFVVYLDSVTPDGPLVQTALYLHYHSHEASPKAISERTSYLQVRLEFHRYPQVIRHHCNGGRFGPPWGFTPTSTCSWVGHPVSGLWQRTLRPIQTRSRFASGTECLKLARYYNSPDRSTKSTPSHVNVL